MGAKKSFDWCMHGAATLAKDKGWMYAKQFVNIIGKLILIFVTMVFHWLVNLYRQRKDEKNNDWLE